MLPLWLRAKGFRVDGGGSPGTHHGDRWVVVVPGVPDGRVRGRQGGDQPDRWDALVGVPAEYYLLP